MSSFAKSKSRLAGALDEIRNDIDSLRDRHAELAAQRRAIESAPLDLKTVEERIDREIAEARGEDWARFDHFATDRDLGLPFRAAFSRHFTQDPFGFLAAIVPDQLKAALLAAHKGRQVPVRRSAMEREAALAKLDQELLAVEIAEEIACREIEQHLGGIFDRRADANPAILLAPDAELL